MIFEQPAKLNRFMAESAAVSWASRRKLALIFFPLLAFIALCFVELVAWQLWNRDQLTMEGAARGLLPAGLLLAFLIAWHEFRGFFGRFRRRNLNVLEDGISFDASEESIIPWSKVVVFWFEDVVVDAKWIKMTVDYSGGWKGKQPFRRTMVLEKTVQYPALLSELDRVRLTRQPGFRIELDKPVPPVAGARPGSILGLWLSIAGMVLFLHGVPLLMASLAHVHTQNDSPVYGPTWAAPGHNKLERFVKAHFASELIFRSRMAEGGGLLCAFGAGLCAAGSIAMRRKSPDLEP